MRIVLVFDFADELLDHVLDGVGEGCESAQIARQYAVTCDQSQPT
jgi:hypothetical protein